MLSTGRDRRDANEFPRGGSRVGRTRPSRRSGRAVAPSRGGSGRLGSAPLVRVVVVPCPRRPSPVYGGKPVRPRGLLIALTVVLLVAGCTGSPGGGGDRAGGDPPVAKVVTAAPGTRLTLVADADPVASSVSTSRALFRTAQVVVLAPEGDPAGTLLGATAAVGLRVPLLVEPKAADARADTVAAELARLAARTALAVGGVGAAAQRGRPGAPTNTRKIGSTPAEPGAVEAATRLHLGAGKAVAAGQEPGAVAALDPGKLAALQPVDAKSSTSAGNGRRGEVPDVPRSHPRSGTLVLATGSPESVAGIATARAAGARVQVTNGLTDPRGSA